MSPARAPTTWLRWSLPLPRQPITYTSRTRARRARSVSTIRRQTASAPGRNQGGESGGKSGPPSPARHARATLVQKLVVLHSLPAKGKCVLGAHPAPLVVIDFELLPEARNVHTRTLRRDGSVFVQAHLGQVGDLIYPAAVRNAASAQPVSREQVMGFPSGASSRLRSIC